MQAVHSPNTSVDNSCIGTLKNKHTNVEVLVRALTDKLVATNTLLQQLTLKLMINRDKFLLLLHKMPFTSGNKHAANDIKF